MDEIQLVEQFAKVRGLRLRGEISRESARQVMLPLLILDIACGYVSKLKLSDFRFQAKHHAKEIHKAYNHANQWFFAGLKDQLEDEAIALMDALEESVKLDVMICETAVWNVFKIYPEPVCGQLVACYMAHVLSAGANAAWESSYRLSGQHTRNRSMTRIQAETKRLAALLMTQKDDTVNDKRIKALRDAESVLGRKLVRWTIINEAE